MIDAYFLLFFEWTVVYVFILYDIFLRSKPLNIYRPNMVKIIVFVTIVYLPFFLIAKVILIINTASSNNWIVMITKTKSLKALPMGPLPRSD
jgi:hypothetical protein